MPTPDDLNPVIPGQSGVPLSQQHLQSHQQIAKALDAIQSWLGLPPNIGGTPLLSRLGVTPNVGPIFWLGDSYEDEVNGYVLNGGTHPYPVNQNSDGHSWSFLINQYFGQQCTGRWIPEGSSPNPLGQLYAVSAALLQTGIPTSSSIAAQGTLLIGDYPGGLPSGSVVILACGINDTNFTMVNVGPVWTSPVTTQWQVTASGGFTIPASGTINIPVVSSTGAVVGTNAGYTNAIGYLFGGQAALGPFTITAVPDGTHITVNTVAGFAGLAVPNNAILKSYGAVYIDGLISGSETNSLQNILNRLVAALPTNGLVILTGPPDVSLLPLNIATGFASFYKATWQYWRNALPSVVPVSASQVCSWDMNQILADVVTNFPPTSGLPSKYGFKNVTSAATGGQNNADFAFYNNPGQIVHPTGAMYSLYAQSFIPFLKARKLLSL